MPFSTDSKRGEREKEDSCIKIGSILKNEKVMAHENSRGAGSDRLRVKEYPCVEKDN